MWLLLAFLWRTEAVSNRRLPPSIVPKHYDIRIDADVHAAVFSFKGHADVEIFIKSSTKRIVIHAAHLTMKRNSVTVEELPAGGAAQRINVTAISHDAETELVEIGLETCLEANRYFRVSIDYFSTAEHNLRGFYRDYYIDGKTDQKKSSISVALNTICSHHLNHHRTWTYRVKRLSINEYLLWRVSLGFDQIGPYWSCGKH